MTYDQKVLEFLSLETKADKGLRPGGLALTHQLISQWPIQHSWLMVDIGCGMGETVHYIEETKACRCIGIDQSPSMIMGAQKAFSNQCFLLGNAEKIPLEAGQADAVLFECSLSAMANPDLVLKETLRILKPGGHIGITDVFLKQDRAGLESASKAVMTQKQWMALFKKAGLQELYFTDQSPVWGSYIASMIWQYGSGVSCDPDLPWVALRQKGIGYFMLTARSGCSEAYEDSYFDQTNMNEEA